ncbi:pseudaminic acid synthase [Pokkaliibacter plantistimulans]|uniref:Pseudaminic acid synthase n=1 Tax=Proteobacteria bacterium 228 TaxID=2083153 RepID=A0A2S5KUA3_9PROT|nr:pseudaminic acid synthase [Pokkaliibacter plantistimulans]PPC78447.1 pseudaminic acid synthase [Pokkaliibacter plantistimulans]
MNIRIGDYQIGAGQPPFIIAELSGNHDQSLDKALAMVDAAARAGAQAIKLQTYTADTMTLDVQEGEFLIQDAENLWKGSSLYQLYQKAHTPWHWHEAIFARARQHGLVAFSTPFDASAVDFLESLQVPCYKIASFENNDLPLIRKVAATGKPIIMSTGMASAGELEEAVACAREAGCEKLILLKCTSAYPAPADEANLLTIPHMRSMFGCEVGLSDHTLGLAVPIAAVTLGATVIEKHFVLDRSEGGVDSAFSLQPEELCQLVEQTRIAAAALGRVCYGGSASEQPSKKFRRSLYIGSDIKAGQVITAEHVRVIRPGSGLAPRYLQSVIGKRARVDLLKGTPLSWSVLE